MVFAGWQNAWSKGWNDVSAALAETIKQFPNDQIIVTGHSQGAAISLLTALAIQNQFGNFADAFDAIFPGKYTGVVNGDDWVPSLPSQPIFRHPSGMVWINPANSTSWKYYPGQENPDGPDSRVVQMFYPGTLQFNWGTIREFTCIALWARRKDLALLRLEDFNMCFIVTANTTLSGFIRSV
ncbi:hypothetical protein FCULG_00000133 [Fusarium culmorum]|uniref:Fungal lipase-type domain-containing protein n=1 Tax=Fusarium culmorum TaxID=5516 RepID=A0A2T4GL65_FUSCU|nr:hypothetical protein FCULG_00000133 [Fusarium culmorum]